VAFIEDAARRWAASVTGIRRSVSPSSNARAFARSIGAATDIVEKEMYTFPDRDGTSLSLRPEGTAGRSAPSLSISAADPLPQEVFLHRADVPP